MADGRERTKRLEIRSSLEFHERMARAARLKGLTLNAYVLSVLDRAVVEDLLSEALVRLSRRSSRLFIAAFLRQGEETPALNNAFARHEREVEDE